MISRGTCWSWAVGRRASSAPRPQPGSERESRWSSATGPVATACGRGASPARRCWRKGTDFGISVDGVRIDFAAVMQHVRGAIALIEPVDSVTALEATFGKVLNIHGAMAHSSAVLQTYAAIQNVLREKGYWMHAAARSSRSLSRTSTSAPTARQPTRWLGKAAGLTEEQTVAIRRGEVDDPRLGSLVRLVGEQAANVGHVQDSSWQAALDAGWTDAELTKTSAVVALNLFTTYFNHLVQTELDLPPAPTL